MSGMQSNRSSDIIDKEEAPHWNSKKPYLHSLVTLMQLRQPKRKINKSFYSVINYSVTHQSECTQE